MCLCCPIFWIRYVQSHGSITLLNRVIIVPSEIFQKLTFFHMLCLRQATDISVIIKYFELWEEQKDGSNEFSTIDLSDFFVASLGIFVVHRIISGSTLFYYTKNFLDFVLGFWDVAIVKSMMVTHKLGYLETSSFQKLIQV